MAVEIRGLIVCEPNNRLSVCKSVEVWSQNQDVVCRRNLLLSSLKLKAQTVRVQVSQAGEPTTGGSET